MLTIPLNRKIPYPIVPKTIGRKNVK